MKLIAGLGNPGEKYRDNRHNTGFRFLDLVARQQHLSFTTSSKFHAEIASLDLETEKILLAKPQMFMNCSGEPVAALVRYYRIPPQNIYIVYDDLDLPLLKVRIREGGGDGGHNGIKSVSQHLGLTDYRRLKIGIGRPDHGQITPWVLGNRSPEEREAEERTFSCLLKHLSLILDGELALAANRIHLCIHNHAETEKSERSR